MKKFLKVLILVLFLLVLIVPNISWGFLKDNEDINYDIGENRILAKFPTEFTGNDYPSEVETWYNDHLPFRSVLHSLYSKINMYLDDLFNKYFYVEEEMVLDYVEVEYEPEEHVHMYLEKDKVLPTCTDSGSAYYQCECGDGFTVNYPAIGHNYIISNEVAPTCTEDGMRTYTCTLCGDTYEEALHATGHQFVITQEGNISCIEQGTVTYTCSVCGYEYSEISLGLGHEWQLIDEKEPTCEKSGFKHYFCSVCGEENTEIIEALGHKYSVTDHKDENCIYDGYTTYTCSICGDSYTDILVHHHVLEVVDSVAASYEDYGYTLNLCEVCGSYVRTDIVDRLEKNTKKAMRYFNKVAIEGRYGWLFYQGDDSEQYYKGTNVLTDKQLEKYNEILIKLDDLCKRLGKQLVIMINPNKEQVYPEFYPTVTVINEEKRIPNMVQYIRTNSNVKIVYPIDELKKAKPQWQVYYKTDTHWNSAGAYIGLKTLYDEIGIDSIDLISLPVKPYECSTGDLINLGNLNGNSNYTHDTNYSILYRPEVEFSSRTIASESLDAIVFSTSNNAAIDKHLVMIGDSFRSALVDFLVKDFTSVTTMHRNSINELSVRQAILDADIIVLEAVERYDSQIFSSAEMLYDILLILDK